MDTKKRLLRETLQMRTENVKLLDLIATEPNIEVQPGRPLIVQGSIEDIPPRHATLTQFERFPGVDAEVP